MNLGKVWRQISIAMMAIVIVISISIVGTIAGGIEDEYTIHLQQPWHQIENYPITNEPLPANYLPVANWVGRLILPKVLVAGEDWVDFEVYQSPNRQFIGKVFRLECGDCQRLGTWDISFTDRTRQSIAQGNIHPTRLDGKKGIGPLRSIAGSRPTDNIIVSFDRAKISSSTLQIDRLPILTTGRIYALVKLIDRDKTQPNLFKVQHYNPRTRAFDDRIESILIPSQVKDRRQFAPFTNEGLLSSPAGKDGWYVYGAIDRQGMFTVRGLQPRSLVRIKPQTTLFSLDAARQFIDRDNWQIAKGELKTTGISNKSVEPKYRSGDRALVLHLFGGIGGERAESLGVPQTISGHFALGIAEVMTDPFTQELIWDIKYHQVYAHNPNGIIAGTHTWANYLGNLQWGWAATRPISDLLVSLPTITQDYEFNGIKISPLAELKHNLDLMMARYRVGDGTGSATVSIATSCVQDANQALYATIKSITDRFDRPQIQAWLKSHPQSTQTQRSIELKNLGESLEKQLLPWGITRSDWANNTLAGTQARSDDSFWAGITSWRSILPRRAFDRLAMLFLKHDADLHFLTTSQIGGWQSQISPLAPTYLLGIMTVPFTDFAPLPIVIDRLLSAITFPDLQAIEIGIIALVIYGIIALSIGFKSGFLNWQPQPITPLIVWLFFAPALLEEIGFRVLFFDPPNDVVNWWQWSIAMAVGIIIFVIYHPLNAKTFYKAGDPTFFNPIFLLLAGLLGLTCAIAYALTGSLLIITTIHWLVVAIWIFGCGGMGRLARPHR